MSMILEGGEELARALETLPDKVEQKFMRRALRKGAQPVLKQARVLSPVAKNFARGYQTQKRDRKSRGKAVGSYVKVPPGTLRDSLFITTKGPDVIVAAARDAYYGNMVQWGTKKMPAHPFLDKALESQSEVATQIIAADLKTSIEKAFQESQ